MMYISRSCFRSARHTRVRVRAGPSFQLGTLSNVNTYSKPAMYDVSKCGNVTRRS